MIDREHDLPITRQAEVLNISRGSVYYLPRPAPEADLAIMRRLDQLHLEFPFAGSRMLRGLLAAEGCKVGRRHVKTLMRRMGIEALYRRPRTTKPEPETAVKAAADQVKTERDRGGCKDICRQREADERTALEALRKTQADRATTIKAAQLDASIAEAEAELGKVDVSAAVKETDPQSASMAKAIGADQDLIAALSHVLFAVAIELGSGVGFWLVFGHGGPGARRDEAQAAATSTALVPIDRSGAQDLEIIDETPADMIERFFLEVVRPRLNGRVQSLAVWSAYGRWCADRSRESLSHAMFGRLARWRKDRIGGTVWYLDCELAEGYRDPAPSPRSLLRLGAMAKAGNTAH